MTIARSRYTYGNDFRYVPEVFEDHMNEMKIDYSFSIDRRDHKNDGWITACIVIPTYNEALNIPRLLKKIFDKNQKKIYDLNRYHIKILFVDDSSPDGTQRIIRGFQRKNKNIHLLSRDEKNGLGAAYIAGMKHALKKIDPDVILEMDADLSHDPKYLLPLLDSIREGNDFVIGSRYIEGGSIPDNWGLKRKMLSRSANLYAKTLLNIGDVNDCTGGFRAIRASKLKEIDLESLSAKGYVFQISLLDAMRKRNARFKEIPIDFVDRTEGESKMAMSDMIEGGFLVLNMSLRNIFGPKKNQERKGSNKEDAHRINIEKYTISSKNKEVDSFTMPKPKLAVK